MCEALFGLKVVSEYGTGARYELKIVGKSQYTFIFRNMSFVLYLRLLVLRDCRSGWLSFLAFLQNQFFFVGVTCY